MIKLISRNGILYVEYIEYHKRVRRSLKIKDTSNNRLYASKHIIPIIENRLKLGISITIDNKFSSLAKEFLSNCEVKESTIIYYKTAINKFIKVLLDRDIKDYSIRDIDILVNYYRSNLLKNSSITTRFIPIKQIFKLAIRKGIITFNPCILNLKCKSVTKIPFTYKERDLMLNRAKGWFKTFLYIAFYTGARAGEILALTTDDINLDSGIISINKSFSQILGKVTSTKNGKSRKVFIPNTLIEYLKEYNELNFAKNYFHQYKILLKDLNIPYRTFHTIRHSYISYLVKQGVELNLIKEQVGHSNLDMISRVYSHYIAENVDRDIINNAFGTTFVTPKNIV